MCVSVLCVLLWLGWIHIQSVLHELIVHTLPLLALSLLTQFLLSLPHSILSPSFLLTFLTPSSPPLSFLPVPSPSLTFFLSILSLLSSLMLLPPNPVPLSFSLSPLPFILSPPPLSLPPSLPPLPFSSSLSFSPSSSLPRPPPPPPPPTHAQNPENLVVTSLMYADAVWDRVGLESDELSFRVGDVIEILDMSDDTWWQGNVQEKSGWFPSAFVRVSEYQGTVDMINRGNYVHVHVYAYNYFG